MSTRHSSAAAGTKPISDKVSGAAAGPADPNDGRGRTASHPLQIPPPGWKDVLLRVKEELKADNLSLVAAGVAFYFMLALFPALIATVSVYGLVADPATVNQQIARLLTVMPTQAGALIAEQLGKLVEGEETGLGLSLVVGLLVAIWSASKGARALITGLNIAYEETERRGFFKQQLVSLVFTLGFVVFASASIGLIAVLPHVVDNLPVGDFNTRLTFAGTWALVLALLLLGLAAVYRYGPARRHARWQWVSLGSGVAALLWLLASLGFAWYAAHFGSFNATYGALAGVILLLLWLQITAFVTLLGAEINAEVEHQTAQDSTVGPPRPMGERDAVMADTLGAALGAAGDDDEATEGKPRASESGRPGSESPRPRIPGVPGSRDRLS